MDRIVWLLQPSFRGPSTTRLSRKWRPLSVAPTLISRAFHNPKWGLHSFGKWLLQPSFRGPSTTRRGHRLYSRALLQPSFRGPSTTGYGPNLYIDRLLQPSFRGPSTTQIAPATDELYVAPTLISRAFHNRRTSTKRGASSLLQPSFRGPSTTLRVAPSSRKHSCSNPHFEGLPQPILLLSPGYR